MTSVYEGLICDLKIKLKNKNIKFNKIFSLINNEKYDEIIEINVDQKLRKMETIYQKFEHRIEYEFDPNEECFITVQ